MSKLNLLLGLSVLVIMAFAAYVDAEDAGQEQTRTGLHLRKNWRRLNAALAEVYEVVAEEVNPLQLLVDVTLIIFSFYVVLKRPMKVEKPLSKEEIEELIADWDPEPLFPSTMDEHTRLTLRSTPLIESSTPTHVVARKPESEGSIFSNAPRELRKGARASKTVLNLARTSYLGFVSDETVTKATHDAVDLYGCGSCGPRGFYGTLQAHLDLEKKIRDFAGSEDAIIFAYGFATISSVIPCFSGRGDLLIVDKGISFPTQTGVKLSRSDVKWFNHNDMDDLERVLEEVAARDRKPSTPVSVKKQRRFIIVEGVYANTGSLVNLPKVFELKEKYHVRVIMDESFSFGLMGEHGRGVTEHYNMPVTSIELITANLATTTGSVGGLCLGDEQAVYHMRLHATGYVFSASLPALLAKASEVALGLVDGEGEAKSSSKHARLNSFWSNRDRLRSGLNGVKEFKSLLVTQCSKYAPFIRLELAPQVAKHFETIIDQETVLQDICDQAFDNGVLIARTRHIWDMETYKPVPAIHVSVNSAMSTADIDLAVKAISDAAAAKLGNLPVLRKSRTMEETVREGESLGADAGARRRR